ncbi:lamin-B receptor [Chironomus tepperi]|uniref:lamin-B receptor n=1 Tax=Chironomus tepperi TaxID=113505 RepID=UPI00391EFED2
MEKRVSRTRAARERSPPSSRTRSKSPARVEVSGRDSAPIKKTRTATRKIEKEPEEVSSSSQSSTPKKLSAGKKEKIVLEDSADNEEVANINARSTRLSTLRKRTSPIMYKNTPTPSTTEEIKRSVSRTASSLTKEDSDENDEEVELVPNQQTEFQNLGIFTKPLVNFLLLILLAVFPIIIATASKVGWKCSLIIPELKNIENFVTLQAFSFSVAIHSLSVLVSLLPVGRFVKLPDSEKEYKFNGTLAAFILTGILFALEFKNLDSLTAVYNNVDRLLFLSIAKCLMISVFLVIIQKYNFRILPNTEVNPYGNSGKFWNDLVAGRELNPKPFGFVDLKRVIYVQSIIYILVINIAYLYKNVTIPAIETTIEGSPVNELIKQTYNNFIFIVQNSEYNLAGFVASSLLILYALDLLIFEHHLATSFQLNDEGLGAEVLLRYATFPFLICFIPRYLFTNNIVVNSYVLAFAAVIFIIGLVIKRCSNCLKYEYRIHPNDAKFKDLATLPTFQNHRLIIGKWWSRIRQPNLFGEILLHLALLNLLTPKFDCSSFFGIFTIIAYLIYRSISINRKNAIKYESSWQRYTSAVKYNLLPRVY